MFRFVGIRANTGQWSSHRYDSGKYETRAHRKEIREWDFSGELCREYVECESISWANVLYASFDHCKMDRSFSDMMDPRLITDSPRWGILLLNKTANVIRKQ